MYSDVDKFFNWFDKTLPDEDAACALALELFLPQLSCCGGNNFIQGPKRRTVRCEKCLKCQYFTANTFLHKVKSIRSHIAAIWVAEAGVIVSDAEFARRLKVAQSTGWSKVRIVGRVVSATAKHFAELFSFLFKPVVKKRSKVSPPIQRPCLEEDADAVSDFEMNCGKGGLDLMSYIKEKQSGDCDLIEEQITIFNLLADGLLHEDQICDRTNFSIGKVCGALMMLELHGLVIRLRGGFYKLIEDCAFVEKQLPAEDKALTASIAKNIYAAHRGVSRKYIQLHAACGAFKEFPAEARNLLSSCIDYGKITIAQIVAYVSPKILRIPVQKPIDQSAA